MPEIDLVTRPKRRNLPGTVLVETRGIKVPKSVLLHGAQDPIHLTGRAPNGIFSTFHESF